jgi:sulfur transfer protein SufE
MTYRDVKNGILGYSADWIAAVVSGILCVAFPAISSNKKFTLGTLDASPAFALA